MVVGTSVGQIVDMVVSESIYTLKPSRRRVNLRAGQLAGAYRHEVPVVESGVLVETLFIDDSLARCEHEVFEREVSVILEHR